jgi:Fe-S cluster biogenesis protein NfuA
VAKSEAFQDKLRQIGALVSELDAAQNDQSSAAARELVHLLMDVHGTALQRLMEIVFDSGTVGEAIILQASEDPIVRQLMLLYSLHPDGLETRVLRALESARPRLRKHNSEAKLIGISEGVIQIKVHTTGHACGSTGKTVQSLIEECVYDQAPDLVSLEIIGHEDQASSGFVSIESLLKPAMLPHAINVRSAETVGAD